jgi:hypothetical protein
MEIARSSNRSRKRHGNLQMEDSHDDDMAEFVAQERECETQVHNENREDDTERVHGSPKNKGFDNELGAEGRARNDIGVCQGRCRLIHSSNCHPVVSGDTVN